MRSYGVISPQFWMGPTGEAIKSAGSDAVVVALYLMTSPHANMIGLYYLPITYLAHDTGLSMQGAYKGLQRASEAGLCTYDESSKYVFVHKMARFQVGESLQPTDKRCVGVVNTLKKCPKGPLYMAFVDEYRDDYNLDSVLSDPRPLEAPSMPVTGAVTGTGNKPLAQQAVRFPEFWEIYPNKQGKAKALEKWKSRGLDKIADEIIANVKARIDGDGEWADGYTPHGVTYINGSRWEDEVAPMKKGKSVSTAYVPMPGEK